MINDLLDAGLLHNDVTTVMGQGLDAYRQEPKLTENGITFVQGTTESQNDKILRPSTSISENGRFETAVWKSGNRHDQNFRRCPRTTCD